MKSLRGIKTLAGIAVLSGALLGGCVVAPAPGYYGGGAVVTVAPPAPQYEVVGVAPTPGFVWFGGYWNWVGGTSRVGWRPLGSGSCRLPLGAACLGA